MSTSNEQLKKDMGELKSSWNRFNTNDWRINAFGLGAMASYAFRFVPILPLRLASYGFTAATAYSFGQRDRLIEQVEQNGEKALSSYKQVMSNDPVSQLSSPQMLDNTIELARQFPISRVKTWNDSDLEGSFWGGKPVPDEVKETLTSLDTVEKRDTNFRVFDTADVSELLAKGRGFFDRVKQTSKDYGFDVDEAWENMKKGPKP